MRVLIKSCSVPKYWYADRIGETFTLVDDTKHEIRENSDSANACYVVIHNNKEYVVVVDDCEMI